ncbi:MAG: OsmC family protein [Acidobacteria bacterium]|nr:OsmC family protein [Acidobacteriota bacterium]
MPKAKIKWVGEGLGFLGEVETGAPLALRGGKEGGPSPMELLLIAIAGCSGMDVISILEKMKLKVRRFEVEIEGERASDHPKRYKKIELLYRVYGKGIPEERVNHAIELSQEKYCGALASLREDIEIKSRFEIIEED